MDVITIQALNKVLRRMNSEYGGMYEHQVATEGQDTFTTTTDFSMNDDHTLHVYVDGALAVETTDYTKVNSKTIKFTNPLHEGETVLVTTELAGSPKYTNPPYDDATIKNDISNINTALLAAQNAISNIKSALDENGDGIIETIIQIRAQWEAADSNLQNLINDKVSSAVTDAIIAEITNARSGKATLLDRLNEIITLIPQPYNDSAIQESINSLSTDMTNINNEVVVARDGKNSLLENLNIIKNSIPGPYDDTQIKQDIQSVSDKVTALQSKTLSQFTTTDTVTNYEYTIAIVNSVVEAVLTDNGKVAKASDDLTLGDTTAVTSNLTLPTSFEDCVITWNSDNLTVIAVDGTVARPVNGTGNITVNLTATITSNVATKDKVFSITVLEQTV